MPELLKVIKYEGDDKTLVYKYPDRDFNTKSQLIVHQSQEAILFKDGKALDVFAPGKYELKTENIPLLRSIINIPTEGVSPFHCEVYFINKAMSLNVDWGTSSRFDVLDPTFGIPLSVGASGTMEFVIRDSRDFLINIVGTQEILTSTQLSEYFRGKIVTKVKSYLATLMNEVSYLNLSSHLDEVSEALKNKLNDYFYDYGVSLKNFYVSTIHIPEEDTNKVKTILNKKLEYGTLDYNWADEQIAEISKRYASNPGTNDNVGGMIAQIPLAMAFGEMLGSGVANNMSSSFLSKSQAFSNNSQVNNQQDNQVNNNQNNPVNNQQQINNQHDNPVNSQQNNQVNNQQQNFNQNPGIAVGVSNEYKNNFCMNCGCKLRKGAKFCPNCGTIVQINEILKCPNCNAVISQNDNFCMNCGFKLK